MAQSSKRSKWVSLCVLLFAYFASTIIAEDGLVANGDFETPPSNGFPSMTPAEGTATGIPSWKTNGTVELVKAGQKQGGMILIIPEGRHAVRLGNDAEISQDLKVEKGSTYSVTFSAARKCAQLESLNVSVPPASQTIDLQTLHNMQGWNPYAWSFEAEGDDVTLVFSNLGVEDDPTCGPIILGSSSVLNTLGLVANGDFETPPSNGFPSMTSPERSATGIPSWKTNGTVELVEAGKKQGGMILIIPEGRHAVRLGKDAVISQDPKVEKGSTYSVTFRAARTCAQLESLNVSVPPASQTIDLQTPYNVQGWDPYAWSFEAEGDDVTLVFRSLGIEDEPTCGPIIDDIAIKKLLTPDKPKVNSPSLSLLWTHTRGRSISLSLSLIVFLVIYKYYLPN